MRAALLARANFRLVGRFPLLSVLAITLLLTAPATSWPATDGCPYCRPKVINAHAQKLGYLTTLLWNKRYRELDAYFDNLQQSYEAGKISDYELIWPYNALWVKHPDYEPRIKEWLQRFPNSYAAHVAAGAFMREVGYRKHYAEVTAGAPPDSYRRMGDKFRDAILAFQASLPLVKKPLVTYCLMIRLGPGYGDGPALKRLLDEALKIEPKSVRARTYYLRAIAPNWGGTYAAMEAIVTDSERAGLEKWQVDELKAIILLYRIDDASKEKREQDKLRLAAEAYRLHESLETAYQYASALYFSKDYERALPIIERSLEYAPADGYMLSYRGYILESQRNDPAAAVRDYRYAAELGNAWSQRALGKMLWNGFGTKQDKDAAVVWMRKAAKQGDAEAIQSLKAYGFAP